MYFAEFFPEIQVKVLEFIVGVFVIIVIKLEYDEYSQTGSLCLPGWIYAVKVSLFTIVGHILILILHIVAYVSCRLTFVSIVYFIYETSEKILTTCQQHGGIVEVILRLNRIKLEKLQEQF